MQGLPYVPTVVCLLFKVVNNSPRAFPPRPAPRPFRSKWEVGTSWRIREASAKQYNLTT